MRGYIWLPLAALVLGGVSDACDVPVYAYALEHWPRQTYHVLRFALSDQTVGAVADAPMAHANMAVHDIAPSRIADYPENSLVLRVWQRHRSDPLPLDVVVAPNGRELFSGRLTAAEVGHLVTSPAREQLVDLLGAGKQGVLLLLTGSDGRSNQLARETIDSVLCAAREAGHDVGMLVVAREDAAERWLVRQLLTVRRGLENVDAPMLFPVFGRGCILAPLVARRISPKAAMAFIAFFNGPCTCDIRGEYATLDLLTDHDWQSAASGGPLDDERPYYSLLAPAAVQQPPDAIVRQPDVPATDAHRRPVWMYRLAFVLVGAAVVALAVGHLVVRRGR